MDWLTAVGRARLPLNIAWRQATDRELKTTCYHKGRDRLGTREVFVMAFR